MQKGKIIKQNFSKFQYSDKTESRINSQTDKTESRINSQTTPLLSFRSDSPYQPLQMTGEYDDHLLWYCDLVRASNHSHSLFFQYGYMTLSICGSVFCRMMFPEASIFSQIKYNFLPKNQIKRTNKTYLSQLLGDRWWYTSCPLCRFVHWEGVIYSCDLDRPTRIGNRPWKRHQMRPVLRDGNSGIRTDVQSVFGGRRG